MRPNMAVLIYAVAFLLFAALPARADLIDIAIEVVNPDLKPARPVVDCVIKGGEVSACAIQKGMNELNENEDIKRIKEVYDLAKAEQWEELVVKVGLAVVCTAFEIPAKDIVCSEFGAKVAAIGVKVAKFATDIHKKVGEKVLKYASKVGCVTGVYCPSQSKKDPNKFYWHHGSTTLSMAKFDLGTIWTSDYAPRIGEGISARLNDIAKLQRMIAVPPPRMTVGGNKKLPTPENTAKAQALGGKSAADLKYFLHPDALASGEMNKHTAEWFAVGVTGELTNVHLDAFKAFEREMNARWLTEVNKATGELLEPTGQSFLAASAKWKQELPQTSIQYFDAIQRIAPATINQALAPCRAAAQPSGVTMFRWARGSSTAGPDGTNVSGHNAAWWIAQSLDWCGRMLAADMDGRRHEFNAAMSWGCLRKANGSKGLECPAQAVPANKKKFGDDPEKWTPGPAQQTSVLPIELCRNAYEVNGSTNPQYCTLLPTRAPRFQPPQGTRSPVRPDAPEARREPAPAPQVSTLCVFDAGPRAGQRQDYAPMAPIPVGTPCHDGRGSTGHVVAP